VTATALLAVAGCGRRPSGEASLTQAPAADSGLAGRVVEPPRPNQDGQIRILLSHDMEGLSGQSDWRTFMASHPEHFKLGQQLLAADVNAVIEGLFAGGATAVDVFDQHGSGQPDSIPDLPPALLDRRAKQVFMSEAISADLAAKGNYDALVTVGEHGRTGSGGFAAHSVTLGTELFLNDIPITEVELKAYQWGQFGVPLIFSSGDDVLQRNLAGQPWIQYVVVKHATSASSADLRSVDSVHAEMRAKAKRAVERISGARVIRLTTPIRVTIGAVPPATLAGVRGFPGIDFHDQQVRFTVPTLGPEAFAPIISVISLAAEDGRAALLIERLRADGRARGLLESNEDAFFLRWMDYESGRWKPK